MTFDHIGNMYFTASQGIYMVNTSGIISSYAGNTGLAGFAVDGCSADTAALIFRDTLFQILQIMFMFLMPVILLSGKFPETIFRCFQPGIVQP
jgi:hypothetical protein